MALALCIKLKCFTPDKQEEIKRQIIRKINKQSAKSSQPRETKTKLASDFTSMLSFQNTKVEEAENSLDEGNRPFLNTSNNSNIRATMRDKSFRGVSIKSLPGAARLAETEEKKKELESQNSFDKENNSLKSGRSTIKNMLKTRTKMRTVVALPTSLHMWHQTD